ncbi:JAB domain-containing protein [Cellulophaga lytica]|uniref:JAB domain-containing protein n=1 Tax=Cellulophaga TaxID=104264 RepID=UPI0009871D3C|nr:JAB domain-containing protein [Cellulophaga omnivescoria]WKB81805.1 JAB domain-containing protein [Cellulophaga lytica]
MKNVISEITVSYMDKTPETYWRKINSSKDASELLYEHWNKNTIAMYESFKVILLANNNRVKGIFQLSQGGINSTLIDVRILFAVVLKSLSVGIILSHNHPSGTLSPSEADKNITKKIKQAAVFFDIKVLDHLIITPNGNYYSFADNALL